MRLANSSCIVMVHFHLSVCRCTPPCKGQSSASSQMYCSQRLVHNIALYLPCSQIVMNEDSSKLQPANRLKAATMARSPTVELVVSVYGTLIAQRL